MLLTARSPFGTFVIVLLLLLGNLFASSDYDLKCDFSSKICNWDGLDGWTWIKPELNSHQLDGPPKGIYANTNALLAKVAHGSHDLTSPRISDHFETPMCFTFAYYVAIDQDTFSGLTLEVLGSENGKHKTIWSSGSMNSDLWQSTTVRIDSQSGAFYLRFSAHGNEGFAALQATQFHLAANCPPSNVCDFESGTCGYTAEGNSSTYQFEVDEVKAINGVPKDHTNRSPYGHIAYLGKFGTLETYEATFTSPRFPKLDWQCFSFWFFLGSSSSAPAIDSLDLKLLYHNSASSDNQKVIWKSDSTHRSGEWHRIQRRIDFSNEYGKLIFQADRPAGSRAVLALDDIAILPFACDAPVSCPFTGTTCNWKDDTSSDNNLLWSFGIGRVRYASQLKTPDVLVNSGNILYSDFTAQQGSMEMLSEFVDSPTTPSGACLTLKHLVQDFNDALFEVSQIDANNKRTVLWQFTNTNLLKHPQVVNIAVPNPSGNVPYRFSIKCQSTFASTFISISAITYSNATSCPNNVPVTSKTTTSLTTASPFTAAPGKTTLDCNFEVSYLCNWNMDRPYTFFNIKTITEALKSNFLCPLMDHTKSSRLGHIVYVAQPLFGANTLASGEMYIANPYINQTICFTFYYYFIALGRSNFYLTMDMTNPALPHSELRANVLFSETVFHSYGDNELSWKEASLTLEPKRAFDQFTFQIKTQHAFLAFDDIKVVPGKCAESSTVASWCDFEENSSCMFEPLHTQATGLSEWALFQGRTVSPKPIADRTTTTIDGHFYGLDLSKNVPPGTYEIISKKMDGLSSTGVGFHCFEFSYYLEDVSPNTTLFFGFQSGSEVMYPLGIWQASGGTAGIWFRHHQELNFQVSFSVIMGIKTVDDTKGKIFIDDIVFNRNSRCKNTHFCDFQDGTFCNLQPVQQEEVALTAAEMNFLSGTPVGSNITSKYLTSYVDNSWFVSQVGKSANYIATDHTVGAAAGLGRYLLLTSNGNPTSRAIVITDRFTTKTSQRTQLCFSFAAFLKDSTYGSLEVYQGESRDSQFGLKLWQLKRKTVKGTANDWEEFQILGSPLNPASRDIFFYIVGLVNHDSSYIAIDDVQIRNAEECSSLNVTLAPTTSSPGVTTPTTVTAPVPKGMYRCRSGKLIAENLKCNWVKNCDQGEDEIECGSCPFNHNWCGYTQSGSLTGEYSFQFSDQTSVGPSSGVMDNNFLVASGDWAASTFLESPIIHSSYLFCSLSFYYQYNETTSRNNKAHVSAGIRFPGMGNSITLWDTKLVDFPQNTWNQVTIPIGRVPREFKIVITASEYYHKGIQYQAIDHVKLENCHPSPPDQFCGGFQCANKVCIRKELLCDFNDDCGDASDEATCDMNRMTSFENGYGLWGREMSQSEWRIVGTVSVSDIRVSPTFDHTTRYLQGHYLLAKAEYSGKNTTVLMEIDSPWVTPREDCILRFYSFSNSLNGSLMVTKVNLLTNERTFLGEKASSDGFYDRQEIAISSAPSLYYKIIITASLKLTSIQWTNPYIAIDDISFSSGCIVHQTVPQNVTLPDGITVSTMKPNNCPTLSCTGAKNGSTVCLGANQLCDFVHDCKNGEDEANCGDCSFDQKSFCGWTDLNREATWQLINHASGSPGELPKMDALNRTDGGYVAIFSTFGYYQTPKMASPRINGATSELCKLQFSYFSIGSTTIVVSRTAPGSRVSLGVLHKSGNWQTIEIAIGKQSVGLTIEIEAGSERVDGNYRDVAIDDIRWINCRPNSTEPTTDRPINITHALDCSFEDDLCGWEISGPSEMRSNWMRTSSSRIDPGKDHTSLQDPPPPVSGTWLTTQAKLEYTPETDYLKSTYPLKPGQTYCFTFWYFFFDINLSSKLSVYTSKSGKTENVDASTSDYRNLWSITISKFGARNWVRASIEIHTYQDALYLYFIAKATSTSVIGLDDFTLQTGSCPTSPEFCDFEISTCDWSIQGDSWNIDSSLDDHSTGTSSGHYLTNNYGTDRTAVMRKAITTLPQFQKPIPKVNPMVHGPGRLMACFRLYYYFNVAINVGIIPDNSTQLAVRILNGNDTKPESVHSVTTADAFNDDQLKTWTPLEFHFFATKDAIIEIDGTIGDASTAMFIDDISVSTGNCQSGGSCNFEYDFCGWTNEHKSFEIRYLLWMRVQPLSLFLKGSLLHFDHTSGKSSGNYLLLPTQLERSFTSTLQSPILKREYAHWGSRVCFRLYYFATSANSSVVALRLSLLDLTHKDAKKVNLNLPATASLAWTKFEYEFEQVGRVYQFQIQTMSNSAVTSQIGIDDITVHPGACQDSHGNLITTTTTAIPPKEQVLDCSFDSGNCNWDYGVKAVTWKVTDSLKETSPYVPQLDHTSQTPAGQYLLFASPTPFPTFPDYTIASKVNLPLDKDHCFTVWYYEDGEGAFDFRFFINLPFLSSKLASFESSIENRARWNLVKVSIPRDSYMMASSTSTKTFGLTIHYLPSVERLKQFHVFAFDDIKVVPGLCSHQYDYTYTFSEGYEDLSVEMNKPLKSPIGEVVIPKTDKVASGAPAVDHSTGTANGAYFLFMNSGTSSPTTYLDTLSIMNVPADKTGHDTCLRFAYQLYGNATLKVYSKTMDEYDYTDGLIWTATKNAKTSWTIAEVNHNEGYKHKFVFYLEKQADKSSFIALDDLTVLGHRCAPIIDCDFDDHRICSYTSLTDTQTTTGFNFGVMTAPVNDSHWPGPQYDNSGNWGGAYLYLTSFRKTSPTQLISKIISGTRVVDNTKTYCLSFSLYMSSSDVELDLQLLRYGPKWVNNLNAKVSFFHFQNTTQGEWTTKRITLRPTLLTLNTQEIALIIEGRIGANSKGLIGLDGITLSTGECQDGLLCEDGHHVSPDKVCNFVCDCKSCLDEVNCGNVTSFETGLGPWRNLNSGNSKWAVKNAAQAAETNPLAPKEDADRQTNGHYLLLGVSSMADSFSAEMALNYGHPDMYTKNAYKGCQLQFDYYLAAGSNQTTNRLLIQMGEDAANWNTVYLIAAQSSNGWHRAYAHLGFHYAPFMVDIQGTTSNNGLIALDNIQFHNCSYPYDPNHNACFTKSKFECRNKGFCLSYDYVCNYENDCGDGSDETHCNGYQNFCNFEESLQTCRITTDASSSDVAAWTITSGQQSYTSNLPKIDNTKRSKTGHFFALQPKATGNVAVNQADFYSPMWHTASQQSKCTVRFFYFINGPAETVQATKLQLFIQYANKLSPESKSIAEVTLGPAEESQQRWNMAIVKVSSPSDFQFVFRGILGDSETRLAIDDITYDSACFASTASRLTTTTGRPTTSKTTNSNTDTSGSTVKPPIKNNKPEKGSDSIKIAIGVTVPILVVLALAIAFYAYRRHLASKRNSDNVVLSMKEIQSRYTH